MIPGTSQMQTVVCNAKKIEQMELSLNTHRISAFSINFLIVAFLLYKTVKVNDGKEMLIYIFLYIVLLVLNSIVWLILMLLRNNISMLYGRATLILLILFMPLFFFAARL
jgi:hypothetical protein